MSIRSCDESFFRALVESLPIVTYIVASGVDGRTLYVSPQMERLLGYPVQSWLDDPDFFAGVVHPEDRLWVLSHTEARAVTEDMSATFRVVAKDGRVVTIQSDFVVKRDERGQPSHVLGFWIDVSERVKLTAELRQAQKLEAIGRLAAGVAHDFNNVLLAQCGYGELALQHLERGDPAAAQNDIREVLAAAGRGATLTRQLLTFSRRQTFDLAVLDLNAVVVELEGLVRTLVGGRVALALELAAVPTYVLANRAQLEQLVTNLAVNARDAMPDGGELRVSVAAENNGDTAVLEVADTGHGMTAATADRIFDPFFTTKGTGGTGLGLATVHGIVMQSGGSIEVRSTPGQGTTFTITLPATAPPANEGRQDSPAARAAGETVVLVEDDAAVRAAVAAMLESHGYHVRTAANADEALQLALDHGREIDLVVIDVALAGRNGPATAALLREHQPGLAVLYMSGHTDEVRLPELGPETRAGFIRKPFSASALARALETLLRE